MEHVHSDANKWPLEPSPEAFLHLVEAAAQRLASFLSTLPDQPSWQLENAETIARSVFQPIPESPEDATIVLQKLFEDYIPLCFNTAGPGYMAYIPGGGLPTSAVADLISNVVNRYVGVWWAAPALAQIERTVIRWFCELVDYPLGSGGVLTTGGSLSTVIALYTARRKRCSDDLLNATVYTSDQAHHSVMRAASFVGFPLANVRTIAVDSEYRIRVDMLEYAIRSDRASGYRPVAIVGNAGTTNTGACDNLVELASIAARESMWLHVDAAYGGYFAFTARGRTILQGLELADSITLDPHKGLFLPYGTGCLLVRDQQTLLQAHEVQADYLPPPHEEDDFVDFCRLSPELSRDARGLRIWFPFMIYGANAFRRALDEKLDLINWAYEQLCQLARELSGQLEIVAPPQLTIVAFRYNPGNASERELEALNRNLCRRINAGRRVYLSTTMLAGRLVLRICILSFRTHQERVAECISEIRRAVSELSAQEEFRPAN